MGQPTKTKTSSTQTRNVAPMSQPESLLQQANMQAAQQQTQSLQDAMKQQQQYESSPGYQAMQGIGGQAATGLSGLMANGMMPSGQQQQALSQFFQSIMAPQQQQMQQVAQQEAARRGMTIADSPIGNGYLQNLANYNAQMGGQQAGQGIQLGQNMANQYQGAMDFGNRLQQNAQQNRLALTNAQPGSYNFGNQLAQNRIASAPVTSTQTQTGSQPFSQSFGQYAQGAHNAVGAGQGAMNLWSGSGTGQTGTRPLSEMFGKWGLGG